VRPENPSETSRTRPSLGSRTPEAPPEILNCRGDAPTGVADPIKAHTASPTTQLIRFMAILPDPAPLAAK